MTTIGKRIAQLREKKGLSMGGLAKLVGVTQVQISNYERDKQLPGIETAIEIARALDVTLSYLVQGKEMSALEKLVPIVDDLPKSVQSKIQQLVKDQIVLFRGREHDKKLLKDLE